MTIIKFRKCTQAQYDALQPPRNPAILYFISDRGWFYLGDTKYYSGTSETGLYLKLDANGKINLAYLYDSILGQMEYAGTFNPASEYPTFTNALSPNDRAPRKGDYFIATGTGTIEGTEFNNKDWLIKTTDGWQHIDNTDAVASVNGKMGVVVLDGTDIQLGGGVTTTIQAKFIAVDTLLDDKINKVEGKDLSTNDYTDTEKTKLTGIEALAEVNIVEGVKVDNVLLTPDVDRIVNVDLSGKVDKVADKSLVLDTEIAHLVALDTQAELDIKFGAKEDIANKGVANGYAPLNASGIIDATYVPSAYTDYIEYATYAGLPATGDEGTLYVVIADETSGDNTSTYRWTGSVYVNVTDKLSASEVKALYESNADTNAYTDEEKTKLTGIKDGAQVNVIEKIKIDGIDLTPDIDKRITLPNKEPAFEKNTAFNKNFGNEENTVCEGDDSRLSDARTPLSHTHGNITNDGKIGIVANKVVVTTNDGKITTTSRRGIDDRSTFPPDTHTHDDRYYTESEVDTLLDDKVDKVEGKALSTNDYTDTEKTKLTGIKALAEVNIVEGVKVDNVLLTPDVDKIITLPNKEPAFEKNTAFNKNFGNEENTVCEGDDSRLSDARTPLAHSHDTEDITDFPTSMPASDVYAWAKAETKPAYTNTEVGAAATWHTHGNINEYGEIGTISSLMVQTGPDGVLTTKAAGTTAQYLRGDGTWSTPPNTVYTHPSSGANKTITAANGKVLSSITVDNSGHTTAIDSKTLVAEDIPNLNTSKLTTGTLGIARGGTGRTDGYAVGVVETRASVLTKIWTGTQAQYDAIGTKDANTLYFIM